MLFNNRFRSNSKAKIPRFDVRQSWRIAWGKVDWNWEDVAVVHQRSVGDIAAVAVAALTEVGHEEKIYNLTGSQSLTHTEMAEHFSVALDRQIMFVDVSPEAMRDSLLSIGLPVWQVDGLLEDYAHYRRQEAAAIAKGVQDAIAQEPRSFKDFAHDYAAMFS